MKPNIKIAALATFLAICVSAYAQEGFIRPELSYNTVKISGDNDSLKDAFGYGIAGGAYFGAQSEHELGLSVGIINFDFKSIADTDFKGSVKTVPLLVNYRYYIGTKADAVRFYLAPSAGYTFLKLEDSFSDGEEVWSDDISETDFTWAIGAGVVFKVADKIDVDVGYRFLQVRANGGHANVNSLYVGGNFRF